MRSLLHLHREPDSSRCEIDYYVQHKQYLVFYTCCMEQTSLRLNRRSSEDVNDPSHEQCSRSPQEYLGNISTKPCKLN